MWRDRTNLYISYRQSYAHHPPRRRKNDRTGRVSDFRALPDTSTSSSHADDQRGLLSNGAFAEDDDVVIELDILPPRWADITDEIGGILADIATKGQLLEMLHRKHVLPGFDDDEAKEAEEAHIEKLTREITRGFQECQRSIRRVEETVRASQESGTIGRAEETMAKNIEISLATRVQEASADFRRKQSAYLKKLRDLSDLATNSAVDRSLSQQVGGHSSLSLQESDDHGNFVQSPLWVAAKQVRHQSNNAAISQREREIQDITQGISELSALFRDLQVMVIDQGTMLDRIDYNLERTNQDVRNTDRELKAASGYQKKTTKRRIILLLSILIGGLFLLLLMKWLG